LTFVDLVEQLIVSPQRASLSVTGERVTMAAERLHTKVANSRCRPVAVLHPTADDDGNAAA
jgi:hypothetical protein